MKQILDAPQHSPKERLMHSLVRLCLRRASQAATAAEGLDGLEMFASACKDLFATSAMNIRSSLVNEKLQLLSMILPSSDDALEPDFGLCAALLQTDVPRLLLDQYFLAVEEESRYPGYDTPSSKLRHIQRDSLIVLLRLLQLAARVRDPESQQPLPVVATGLLEEISGDLQAAFQSP